jgi:hypothetical protein
MQTMLIVHKPGECPRIGYLNPANELASMREWQADNAGAAIYVVQAQELPTPGTGSVYTIEQAIFEAEMAEGPDPWTDDDTETEPDDWHEDPTAIFGDPRA